MSRTIRKIAHAKFYRNPRTQAEKRLVAASEKQGVPVRPKRNPKHLPDAYDDLLVAANLEKVKKKT